MRQVAITGVGIVSAIGNSIEEFSRRMFAGDSGTAEIRGNRVATNFPVGVGGPVSMAGLPQPSILMNRSRDETPHFLRMAGLATEEALRHLPEGIPVDSIVYGSHGSSGFRLNMSSFRAFAPEDFDWEAFVPESPLELIRAILRKRGNHAVEDRNVVSLNNACVSSNQAIGMAFQRVRSGRSDRVITGAVYARWAENELMNFHMLNALASAECPAAEASKPFSKGRSGFVLGEGAATLVLEARELAEARGARILGIISGYASTSDAYRVTDGRPDASSAAQAMQRAVADAGLDRGQIDTISAHGTSTPMNDKVETAAIKRAFPQTAYRIPVISLKSQVGHSVIAAGALEAAASLAMLSDQKLAPTINYKELDPECDLDYVPNVARPGHVQRILSNNFGFGGQNACVVFERSS